MLMKQNMYFQKNRYSGVRRLFGWGCGLFFFYRICYRVVLDRLRIIWKNPSFGLGSWYPARLWCLVKLAPLKEEISSFSNRSLCYKACIRMRIIQLPLSLLIISKLMASWIVRASSPSSDKILEDTQIYSSYWRFHFSLKNIWWQCH